MRIGVLTGGGDCPGLNAAIRAVVRQGTMTHADEFVGFRDGWRGPLMADSIPLGIEQTRGLLPKGGTTLGSSRTNPLKQPGGLDQVVENLARLGIEALVAIGGEDTLGVAAALAAVGYPVIGIPKTIDNDLQGTDYSLGYDTAVNIGVEAMDRLHTTAESHHRVLILEVMGRHAGWIALNVGLAGGASAILVPELPFDIDNVCKYVESRYESTYAPIIVIAEGALPATGSMPWQEGTPDAFGHPRLMGAGMLLEREIEGRTGRESRATVLGHVQRGGAPSAFDRVLATRFGLEAADAIHNGESGVMIALRGRDITRVTLAEATSSLSLVPRQRYEELSVFFG